MVLSSIGVILEAVEKESLIMSVYMHSLFVGILVFFA